MKRKDYYEPTMKVVQLRHRTHLLQASATETSKGAKFEDYQDGGSVDWD